MEVKYGCYQPWKKYYIKTYFRNKDNALGYLKAVCRTITYKKSLRATPKLFSHYQTAFSYYDVLNGNILTQERADLMNNTLSDRRNYF